jgi:hypothetical protein
MGVPVGLYLCMPASWHGGVVHHPKLISCAGGPFFALSIEEAHKLIEKMASNHSWDDEHTPSRTRKVHQLGEVDMLTAKIHLLLKKLENSGLDHLKMVDGRGTCEECGETGHMGVNCPTVC